MMAESWEQGKEIAVADSVTAVCLDGSLWEVRGDLDRVVMTFNPSAALTCSEVRSALEKAVQKNKEKKFDRKYRQSGVSD